MILLLLYDREVFKDCWKMDDAHSPWIVVGGILDAIPISDIHLKNRESGV
jgi:hypothetical protein